MNIKSKRYVQRQLLESMQIDVIDSEGPRRGPRKQQGSSDGLKGKNQESYHGQEQDLAHGWRSPG